MGLELGGRGGVDKEAFGLRHRVWKPIPSLRTVRKGVSGGSRPPRWNASLCPLITLEGQAESMDGRDPHVKPPFVRGGYWHIVSRIQVTAIGSGYQKSL
jgi:hypothetical protein